MFILDSLRSILSFTVAGTILASGSGAAVHVPASARPVTKQAIERAVNAYRILAHEQIPGAAAARAGIDKDVPPQLCPPVANPGACSQEACGALPAYECDDQSEIIRVSQACAGNYGSACIRQAIDMLPNYSRDDVDEVVRLASACRYNYGAGCLQTAQARLPSYQRDDLDEVVRIAESCQGNLDGSCVDFACQRLGAFACDDVSEITAIARSCGGNR